MRCQKVWGQNSYLHEKQICMGHIFLSFTSQHICHSKTEDSTQWKPSRPRPYFHSPLLSAWLLEAWRAPGVENRCHCFAAQGTTFRKRDGLWCPKFSPCQSYLYDPCTECKLFIQCMRWSWYSGIACRKNNQSFLLHAMKPYTKVKYYRKVGRECGSVVGCCLRLPGLFSLHFPSSRSRFWAF